MGGRGYPNPETRQSGKFSRAGQSGFEVGDKVAASSTPTERRMVEGVTPSSFSRWALRPMCDESLGYDRMDSTPPRLVAKYQSFRWLMKRSTAASPPRSSNETIMP